MLQQEFPNWDSLRIMNSRGDHLEWMHRHFAAPVVAGSELLAEIDAEDGSVTAMPRGRTRNRPSSRRSR